MSVPDCFVKVKAQLERMGRKVSTDVLRDMALTLAEKQAQGLDPAAFNNLVAELYVDRLMRDATARRAARLITLQKVEAARAVVLQDVPNMNALEKVNGWILGNARKIGNALNLSVPRMEKTHLSSFMKMIRTALNESGDLKVAERNYLAREVTQELAALERGDVSNPSGSEQALRIAKAYNAAMAAAHELKQAHDPFLGKIQDYFHRASHDRTKISGVTREQWVGFALQKYGEKSFPELHGEKKVEAFADIYDQIIKGTYDSMLDLDADPSDLMVKMAHRRTLIPNSWEAFHEYNQAFGKDNVHTAVLRALESASHDVAMIQKFGPRPGETFNAVMKSLVAKGDRDSIDLLKSNQRAIEDNFKAVTQKPYAPINGSKARVVRGAMGLQQLAKNSTAFLRSWQDMANFATMITDSTGGSYLGNFVEAVSTYAKHFASNQESRLSAMEDMGLFSKGSLYNLYHELGFEAPMTSYGDKIESGLNTLLEVQSHITLMQKHVSAIDAAMADVLSRRLGQLTELAHEQLPVEVANGLKRYGIEKAQWEVIRKGTEDWSGLAGMDETVGPVNRMLNLDGIRAIPDEEIAKYVVETGKWKGEGAPPKSLLQRARAELEVAVGTMVNDHADAASSTAGLPERAWMYGQSDLNSWKGVSLRMLWQFKSAIVKNYDTILRSYYSNPAKPQGDFMKIGRHVVLASGLWAMGETVKTLFEGKTPEDPLQPSFIGKALLNSGAGGIIGDAIISEVTRSESSSDIAFGMLRGAAGPALSTAADVAGALGQLGYSLYDGRTKFPGNAIGRLVTQNLPFQNLFYAKAAINYYLMHAIREPLAPGYVGSQTRRVYETPGLLGDRQEYFMFNPTE